MNNLFQWEIHSVYYIQLHFPFKFLADTFLPKQQKIVNTVFVNITKQVDLNKSEVLILRPYVI